MSEFTVEAALAHARSIGVDRLDAQLLAAHVAGRDRTWVLAHGEVVLDQALFTSLVARRAAGEPLAYLVGEREFHGLRLRVTPDVLVPRPDTETLVDWAIELLESGQAQQVVDLGTGSGAIALAIKHARPNALVHAVEQSAAALAVAQDNALRLALALAFHRGHWWSALPPLRFDLAVSNPPYVAAGDPHLEALRHEPQAALVPAGDGGTGMADIERIISGAPSHMKPGAWLLIEHGHEQAPAVRAAFESRGWTDSSTRHDLAGHPRVSGARRPA